MSGAVGLKWNRIECIRCRYIDRSMHDEKERKGEKEEERRGEEEKR